MREKAFAVVLMSLLVGCGAQSASAVGDAGGDGHAGDAEAGRDAGGDGHAGDAEAGRDAGRDEHAGDAEAGRDASGVASFQSVLDLFAAHCTTCHDAKYLDVIPRYPKLSLTAADAYAALVNAPAHETCGGTLVVPGHSATSYLMRKLLDDPPCEGLHMPRSFEVIPPTPLTAAELASVSRWIDQGASR
jgi:cytochrome c553